MTGSTSRLLHVSGPESILGLIHPGAQTMIFRMVNMRDKAEG